MATGSRRIAHLRSQFVHAVSGVMTVETERGTWVVPPDRALWLPAGVQHAIGMAGSVDMRTLYIRQDASARLPEDCVVLGVTPLLRELIVRATEWPILYDEDGPAAAVMGLILAEIAALPALPLHLADAHGSAADPGLPAAAGRSGGRALPRRGGGRRWT